MTKEDQILQEIKEVKRLVKVLPDKKVKNIKTNEPKGIIANIDLTGDEWTVDVVDDEKEKE